MNIETVKEIIKGQYYDQYNTDYNFNYFMNYLMKKENLTEYDFIKCISVSCNGLLNTQNDFAEHLRKSVRGDIVTEMNKL